MTTKDKIIHAEALERKAAKAMEISLLPRHGTNSLKGRNRPRFSDDGRKKTWWQRYASRLRGRAKQIKDNLPK